MSVLFRDSLSMTLGQEWAERQSEARIDYQFRMWNDALVIAHDAALSGDRAGVIAILDTIGGPTARVDGGSPRREEMVALHDPFERFGASPQEGDTLTFTANIDRSFFARVANARGTITDIDDEQIYVRVEDVLVPALDEWDNQIIYDVNSENYLEFWFTTSPIVEGYHAPIDVADFMLGYCNILVARAARASADLAMFSSGRPFIDSESATVIPFQSNPARKRRMRENPGEIRSKESLDMQAGRLQARDAWFLAKTDPTRIRLEGDMQAELEAASDALEDGRPDAKARATEILEQVDQLAKEMLDARASWPTQWHEYWGNATAAVLRAGVHLVFFTDEPHPSSEDAIATYLGGTTNVSYMDAVNGKGGYVIKTLRVGRKVDWDDYRIGFWMEILRYETRGLRRNGRRADHNALRDELREPYVLPSGKKATIVAYRKFPAYTVGADEGDDTADVRYGAWLVYDSGARLPISTGKADNLRETVQNARKFLDSVSLRPNPAMSDKEWWDGVLAKTKHRKNPGLRRNPGAAQASEEHFPDRDEAIAKYKEFWRLDPESITVAMDITIPTHVGKIGKAHAILYRSGKVDPETLEKVKKPISYIHHIEKGVFLYGGDGDVEVPEFIRGKDGVTSLTRLGDCLGWEVKIDGHIHQADGVAPLPELYAIPSGKALLVIQDKRDVLAIIWGGELGVEDVGIVH